MYPQVRLAKPREVGLLPAIEKAAAQQFVPYLGQLGITAELMEGLTTVRFLQQAQAQGLLWVGTLETTPEATGGFPEQLGPTEADLEPCLPAAPIVGFIVAKCLLQSSFIVELDVHPAYGRRGVGSALVEACCQDAQRRGFGQILLTTFRHVPWNIPFYRRLGFEVWPPERWSKEIRAIVDHEARYGFAPQKRAVMRRALASPVGPLDREAGEKSGQGGG